MTDAGTKEEAPQTATLDELTTQYLEKTSHTIELSDYEKGLDLFCWLLDKHYDSSATTDSSSIPSANEILQKLINPPEKNGGRNDLYWSGFRGGSTKIDDIENFGQQRIKPILEALNNATPDLLNREIIRQTFMGRQAQITQLRLEATENAEIQDSIYFQLYALFFLEQTVKQAMLLPIQSQLKRLTNPKAEFRCENPEQTKRYFLDLVLLKGRSGMPGTEFSRGYLALVRQQTATLLEKFPKADRERVENIVKAANFIRTGEKEWNQTATELWQSILEPLAEDDLDEAEEVIRELILRNSKLFPESVWPMFNLTHDQIEAGHAAYQEAHTHRLAEEAASRGQEKSAATEVRNLAERNEALRPQIEELTSSTFEYTDPVGKLIRVYVEKIYVKNPRTGPLTGQSQTGYVRVITRTYNPVTNIWGYRMPKIWRYGELLRYKEGQGWKQVIEQEGA